MTNGARIQLMVGLLTFFVSWSSAVSQTASGGAASITAAPNPVPPGHGVGRTTITWSTGDDRQGRITLSVNGAPEVLFATNPSGRLDAPWIGNGAEHKFRLYDDKANTLMATVKVTRRDGRSATLMIAAGVVVGLLAVAEFSCAGFGRAREVFRRRRAR